MAIRARCPFQAYQDALSKTILHPETRREIQFAALSELVEGQLHGPGNPTAGQRRRAIVVCVSWRISAAVFSGDADLEARRGHFLHGCQSVARKLVVLWSCRAVQPRVETKGEQTDLLLKRKHAVAGPLTSACSAATMSSTELREKQRSIRSR